MTLSGGLGAFFYWLRISIVPFVKRVLVGARSPRVAWTR
jgi:hypothetical protein